MFPSQICHCPLISSDQKRLSFDHCVINFGGMLKREAQEFQFVRLFHLSHNPLQFERKIATCSFSKIKWGCPDLKHLQKFICFSTRWLSQECEGAADWFVSGFSLIADCLLPLAFLWSLSCKRNRRRLGTRTRARYVWFAFNCVNSTNYAILLWSDAWKVTGLWVSSLSF